MNAKWGYTGILAAHLGSILLDLPLLTMITKPLLVPYLVLLLWLDRRSLRGHGLLVGALVFSWIGDLLLMVQGGSLFVFGLGAFLLAHLLYIRIFVKAATFRAIRLLPFVAFVALLVGGPLYGKLSADLQIPVYVYIAVICVMGFTASLRRSQLPGYELVLIGAVLFILSDSLIALNKFSGGVLWSGFWVMLTYGLAQYFIVKGYLMQFVSA